LFLDPLLRLKKMGHVVITSGEKLVRVEEEEEKKLREEEESGTESRGGGGGEMKGLLRWEKFLPKMVLRVLLVEADDCTRQIITALLRKCNYKGIVYFHFVFFELILWFLVLILFFGCFSVQIFNF
jgi:hypothetical protein